MTKMKRICILFISIVIGVIGAIAEPTFTVKTQSTVAVGDKFPVVYVLTDASASEQSLNAPRINGCKFIYGPTKMSKQEYSNINGRQSSSSTIEFTLIYKAEKEGTFTIPAATIVANGKRLTSKSTQIKVVAGRGAATNTPDVQLDDPSSKLSGAPISANDLFVRINLSKSTAYEYEAIECSIKLYTKYGVREFIATQQPSFDGFLVEDLPNQSQLNQIEEVNGSRYFTAELKRCILFPQKSGKLTIRSGSYDLLVQQFDNVNMHMFSAMTPTYRKLQISSNSASADIKALPSPRPAGFTGAVGSYNIDVRLSSTSFRTNEPASLIYTVSGSGNIRYITDAEIDFPGSFEQFSPEHKVDASMRGNNVVGEAVTTYTFVPQEPGQYTIQVPEFVYFDPSKGEYITIPTNDFPIKVSRGSGSSNVDQHNIQTKNTDIFYIKRPLGYLSSHHPYTITSVWFWLLIILLPICAFVGYRIYRRNQAKGDQPAKRIGKEAERSLKMARTYMNADKTDLFYQEVSKALTGYIASRLKLPIAELNRENIAERLSALSASSGLTQELISLLDTCEMARFTSQAVDASPAEVYGKAAGIIGRLSKLKVNK